MITPSLRQWFLGYLITFRTEALGTSSGRKPNNSFKPNLLRYTKAMAEKACHGFGSTTQVGLTQAICPFQHEIIDRKSVVKGKSVAVRVDRGGRRIIKKKKEKNNTKMSK